MAEMLLRKSVHRKMMLFPACCSYNDVEICHLIIKLLYIKTIIFPKFVQINITNSFNYSLYESNTIYYSKSPHKLGYRKQIQSWVDLNFLCLAELLIFYHTSFLQVQFLADCLSKSMDFSCFLFCWSSHSFSRWWAGQQL